MTTWEWIALAVLSVLLWGYFVEPNWFRIRRVTISGQTKLKKPITILHLSDIHFVKNIGIKRFFFQKLSMMNPDLIFVTGDVIDQNAGIDTAARFLSGLRARYGSYLVLGNHDYYDYSAMDNFRYHLVLQKRTVRRNDVSRFVQTMKDVGIRVLINESEAVDVHGNRLTICGTDDPVTRKPDFDGTFRNVTDDTFNILLTHQPDAVLKMGDRRADLICSGHTHGGQVRIPFFGPFYCDTKLPKHYVAGLNEYNGMNVFVSRGMGAGRYLTPRLACRPEAVLIELRP
jgi:uncharacterized protein